MKRGDVVIVSAAGAYGKPRPAVIIQSDGITGTESVLVALLTSSVVAASIYRLDIEPADANGLQAPSQIMVDKIVAIPRAKCGQTVGRISQTELIALDRMLAVVVGIADRS